MKQIQLIKLFNKLEKDIENKNIILKLISNLKIKEILEKEIEDSKNYLLEEIKKYAFTENDKTKRELFISQWQELIGFQISQ